LDQNVSAQEGPDSKEKQIYNQLKAFSLTGGSAQKLARAPATNICSQCISGLRLTNAIFFRPEPSLLV
jgi:hypothetical protein